MNHNLKLYNKELIQQFILAGKATFTVVSHKTGDHITYRIKKAVEIRDDSKGHTLPWFVSVLNGTDNTGHFKYIGFIRNDLKNLKFYYGKSKAKVSINTKSVQGISWLVNMLNEKKDKITSQCDVYRDTNCGRCGRLLTNPESILNGIGPECLKHIGFQLPEKLFSLR